MRSYPINKITCLDDKQFDIQSFIPGYINQNHNHFYIDNEYTSICPDDKNENFLFLDLKENRFYRYIKNKEIPEASYYIMVQNLPDVKYVDTLPAPGRINDFIYGIVSSNIYTEEIGLDFLDDNDLFEKENLEDNKYQYVPKNNVQLEVDIYNASVWDTFLALTYNGNGEWVCSYRDGGVSFTHDYTDGDTFHFKQDNYLFYAGSREHQQLVPLSAGGGGGTPISYTAGEGIDISNNTISVTPATVSNLGGIKPDSITTLIDANGVLSGNYQEGYGIKIDGNEISTKTFIGTQAEWEALLPAEQAAFDSVSITDDGTPTTVAPGHVILNAAGSELPQRDALQFEGAIAADDSTNEITKITVTPYTAGNRIEIEDYEIGTDDTVKGTFVGTRSEWESLSTADKAKYDIVNLTDEEGNGAAVINKAEQGNLNAISSGAIYDLFAPITATLEAGETTVTFTNTRITETSK